MAPDYCGRSDGGWLLWLMVDLRLLWRISHQPGSFICNDRESREAGRKFDQRRNIMRRVHIKYGCFRNLLCNYLCYFCNYNPDQRRCHILLIWVKCKMIDSRGSIYQNFATLFFLVSTVICWSYCCSSASQWRWSKAYEHPEPRSKMMFPTNIVRFPGTLQEFWGRGRIF